MKKPFHTKHTKRKHRKELKRIPIRKAKRQATWLESLLLRKQSNRKRSLNPARIRDLIMKQSKPATPLTTDQVAIKLGKDRS